MLEAFILRWGYVAVGVGTFLEGEAVLIAAGAFAHRGLLSLPLVMLAAFLGSVCGDQVWFHLGRRAGRSFIERSQRWSGRARRAERWLVRGGTAFVLGFRFVYGIRIATPLLLGATGYSRERFVLLNVAGGAVWAAIFGGVGWALGASLELALQRTVQVEELVAAAFVTAMLMWIGVRAVQRWRDGRAQSTHESSGWSQRRSGR